MDVLQDPELPPIRHPPVLDRLQRHPIYLQVQLASSRRSSALPPSSLPHLLGQRERDGHCARHAIFGRPPRGGLHRMPNTSVGRQTTFVDYSFKCSALSATGDRFVAVCEPEDQFHDLQVYDSSCSGSMQQINQIRVDPYPDDYDLGEVVITNQGDEFVYTISTDTLRVARLDGQSDNVQGLCLTDCCGDINTLAISNCDRYILAGSNWGYIGLYDRHQQSVSQGWRLCETHHSVYTVGFVEDGPTDIVFAGCYSGMTLIYDRRCLTGCAPDRPDPVGVFVGHLGSVMHIDSKRDGRYLLSNSKDQSIKLWDMRMLVPHDEPQMGVPVWWSERSSYDVMPMECYECTVPVLTNDNSIMTYRGHCVRRARIRSRFSPVESTGQRYIYTGSASGHTIVYDLLTGAIVQTIEINRDGEDVFDVVWHPHRPEIISSSTDNCLYSSIMEPDEKSQ